MRTIKSIVFTAIMFWTGTTLGATIYVDLGSTADQLSPSVGTSWALAYNSLREALATAQNGDEILLTEGTYYTQTLAPGSVCMTGAFIVPNGVSIYGGYPAGGAGSRDISAHATIISGDLNSNGAADASDARELMLVQAVSTSNQTVFDGITFELARTAIRSEQASYKTVDCTFRNFRAEQGVLVNMDTDAILVRTTFEDNLAVGRISALLFTDGGSLEAISSHFHDNTSESLKTFGAGMWLPMDTDGKFTNCTFYNNQGLSSRLPSFLPSSSSLELINCSFHSNAQTSPGIVHVVFTDLNVLNTVVYDDQTLEFVTASAAGGVITIDYSVVPTAYLSQATNSTDSDPLLTTPDLHLSLGSSAIDAGLDAYNAELKDGFNNDRIQDGGSSCSIDIGAHERAGTACGTPKLDEESEAVPVLGYNAYPNPSNGVFVLEFSEETTGHIRVYDLQARLILSMKLNETLRHTINISDQPNGVYQVILNSNDRQITHLAMVQR